MLKSNSSELSKHLKHDLKIEKNALVFLHINVGGFGILKNGLEDIFDAFNSVLSEGVLITPAFTYSWNKNKRFTYKSKCSKSDLGIFANYFLSKKKVTRTKNPSFSVAILDNTKKNFFSKDFKKKENYLNCFGIGSVFEFSYKHSLKYPSYILLIGGAHDDVIFRTTFLHYIEEKIGVPYRFIKKIYEPIYKKKILKQYSRYLKKEELPRNLKKKNYNFKIPVIPKYNKLGKKLISEKIIIQKKFKYSKSRIVKLNLFCNWLSKKISEDKLFLLK